VDQNGWLVAKTKLDLKWTADDDDDEDDSPGKLLIEKKIERNVNGHGICYPLYLLPFPWKNENKSFLAQPHKVNEGRVGQTSGGFTKSLRHPPSSIRPPGGRRSKDLLLAGGPTVGGIQNGAEVGGIRIVAYGGLLNPSDIRHHPSDLQEVGRRDLKWRGGRRSDGGI